MKCAELKKCRDTMERLFDKNTSETEETIDRHFRKIHDLIAFNEKLVRSCHKNLKAKQKANFDSYIVFLTHILVEADRGFVQ